MSTDLRGYFFNLPSSSSDAASSSASSASAVDLATSSSPGPSTAKPAEKSAAAQAPAKPVKAAKASKPAKVVEEFDPEAPVFDDCNDIRRKIRAHLAEGNKVTHFLKEIGVNSNSYQRFMALKGPTGGSGNGCYEGAYYFFEEKRIKEGEKKSAKRIRNECETAHSGGFSIETQRGYYIVSSNWP